LELMLKDDDEIEELRYTNPPLCHILFECLDGGHAKIERIQGKKASWKENCFQLKKS
jgi:hypothetical protein